jgi:hypothetical protein
VVAFLCNTLLLAEGEYVKWPTICLHDRHTLSIVSRQSYLSPVRRRRVYRRGEAQVRWPQTKAICGSELPITKNREMPFCCRSRIRRSSIFWRFQAQVNRVQMVSGL